MGYLPVSLIARVLACAELALVVMDGICETDEFYIFHSAIIHDVAHVVSCHVITPAGNAKDRMVFAVVFLYLFQKGIIVASEKAFRRLSACREVIGTQINDGHLRLESILGRIPFHVLVHIECLTVAVRHVIVFEFVAVVSCDSHSRVGHYIVVCVEVAGQNGSVCEVAVFCFRLERVVFGAVF